MWITTIIVAILLVFEMHNGPRQDHYDHPVNVAGPILIVGVLDLLEIHTPRIIILSMYTLLMTSHIVCCLVRSGTT
jgi:hypothetical protein